MTLIEAFKINTGETISLVGSGGKTTLMFSLARELASAKGCVISTTTTKIMPPSSQETQVLLLDRDELALKNLVQQNVNKYDHLTIASELLVSGKLKGISPELVIQLARLNRISFIIVEADGSAQRPLKAPNSTEPVIPPNTSLVIPVVGIESVGCQLTEENVFRSKIASRLLRLPPGSVITAEHVARLLTHSKGVTKGSPIQARIIPFINKVDLPGGLSKARELAAKVMAMEQSKIERIVLGQAQFPNPVVEVVSR